MPLQITSSKFRDELKRRKEAFKGPSISAVLKVPPSLWFIYMQEHGTSTRGDHPTPAYDIYPKNADVLSWVGPNGHRVFKQFIHDHPGIPALHFIAQELEEIRQELAAVVARTLLESGWDFEAVREAFLNIGMEQVKQRVAQAIELRLGKNPRDDGKLKGENPADLFREGAYIEQR
jgi:hypothetical protein